MWYGVTYIDNENHFADYITIARTLRRARKHFFRDKAGEVKSILLICKIC